MREIPREHQIYRHFKGTLYQIVTIAKHSETGEDMVVYRPVYGDSGNWVRPLSMFLSEVDHEKYPDITQKYRFTLMNGDKAVEETEIPKVLIHEKSEETAEPASVYEEPAKVSDEETAIKEETADETPNDTIEDGLNPLLEQFLDARSYQEKLDIFYLMKKKGTMDMLRYVAISLDLEVAAGDFDEMYRQILNCLKTMEKYECNRLRS